MKTKVKKKKWIPTKIDYDFIRAERKFMDNADFAKHFGTTKSLIAQLLVEMGLRIDIETSCAEYALRMRANRMERGHLCKWVVDPSLLTACDVFQERRIV